MSTTALVFMLNFGPVLVFFPFVKKTKRGIVTRSEKMEKRQTETNNKVEKRQSKTNKVGI
jgi:hypothetical protein